MYQLLITTIHKSGNAIHTTVLNFDSKQLADSIYNKLKNNPLNVFNTYREIEQLY
jgi:hypothetical protein